MSNLFLIIQREYLQRVRKKSFIITTFLLPVIMLVLMVLPALLMNLDFSGPKSIGVVDQSGLIARHLTGDEDYKFVMLDVAPDSMAADTDYDAFLIIAPDIIENNNDVALYTHGPSSLSMESMIASQMERAIEDYRLSQLNMEGVREILQEIQANVTPATYRLDQGDEVVSSSTGMSFAIGMIMSIVLYFFLMMYGNMVMTSIIEEKSNRVLDLLVTSVKPTDLMLGKIIGVGLVALTQVFMWAALIVIISVSVLPFVLSPEIVSEVSAFNATQGNIDSVIDTDALQALSYVMNPWNIIALFSWLILFLVGGFLLYASIYAAIGSAVDNVQDASQLQSFVIVPLIIGFVMATSVANDPMSSMSTWLSMIPFTSPMVMMTRIPFGIPTWEIVVSLVILYLSFIVLTWIAAKIYRIGIFMHGKKPNIKDLIAWMKYK